MDTQDLIGKYFWLIGIVIMLINVPFLQLRVKNEIEKYPFRGYQYNKLIMGLTICVIIPWFVMGIGTMFGNVDFMPQTFAPTPWNFFTLLFYGTIILETVSFFIWVWFFNGAKFLAKYGKVFNLPRQPMLIKIMAAGLMVWSVLMAFWR